jgi:1,4-dihydroxy-2-naphthoate octaprenyltransferase
MHKRHSLPFRLENDVASGAGKATNCLVTASALKSCLLAARPKTLPAAIVPVWVGCVLAWKLGGAFHGALAFATVAGAVAIQIATNFFNDAIDAKKGADTARRLGPVRVTASGMMRPRVVMTLAAVFLLLALVCGVFLYQARGWPIVVIGIPSLFLAYGYTGGPFPLAYCGMGELFVILFFGVIAVAGTVFIQTGAWPCEVILLGLQTGLFSSVLISINNLRDREEDSTTGKRTLAVRFGHEVAVAVIILEIMIAVLGGACWIWLGHLPWTYAGIPALLTGILIIRGVLTLPPGPASNRLLALGGVQLILFATAFHGIALIFP